MEHKLIEFRNEAGQYAYIDFEDGELVYGGNIPIHESAKMFIDQLKQYAPQIQEFKSAHHPCKHSLPLKDDSCKECGAVHNGSSEGLPCQYVKPIQNTNNDLCTSCGKSGVARHFHDGWAEFVCMHCGTPSKYRKQTQHTSIAQGVCVACDNGFEWGTGKACRNGCNQSAKTSEEK